MTAEEKQAQRFDSPVWRAAHPKGPFPEFTAYCDECETRVVIASGQHIDDDGDFLPYVEGETKTGFCPLCREYLCSFTIKPKS